MANAKSMSSSAFYAAAGAVVEVDWWLHDCDFPQLRWARMRVFANGYADVRWSWDATRYGFVHDDFAVNFLTEEEYIRFARIDEESETEYGIRLEDISVPEWKDDKDAPFVFLGTYQQIRNKRFVKLVVG